MIAIHLLRKLDRVLTILETAGVTIALFTMVALAFGQVILRNAHVAALPPVPWFPIVTQHLVLWVGMLGASLAAADRRHISIEAISKSLSPRGRRLTEGLVDLAVTLICALLSYVAWKYVAFLERPEHHEIVTLLGVKILAWWSFMILPVGFGLIGFRYFRMLVERILVNEPVRSDLEAEIEEYDREHPSGERAGAPGASP